MDIADKMAELNIALGAIKQQIEILKQDELTQDQRIRITAWARGLIAIAEEIINEGSQA